MQITLDDMIKKVQEAENRTAESPETLAMLQGAAGNLADMAMDSAKITVLTDYDADGITSAYIIQKAIETLNPNCEVDVRPNDRRGSYGLSEQALNSGEFGMDFGDGLVILDMGSPQIPLLEKAYGEGAIILDHHLIKSAETRQLILDKSNYCNPHAVNPPEADEQNAQYCTAGLAYRIYELCGAKDKADEKQNNTVLAIAAIGTAADMVDVLDEHSFNRQILKDGIAVIDKAEPENFDFVVGYMLSQVKISENTTAHELAFNAGAFLNAGGRMSELMGENGAARTYAALTAPESSASTFFELDALQTVNMQRKALVGKITSSPEYQEQLQREKFGVNRESNIAVITLPPDVPHALAGLVAGKFEESADKAVICLTQSSKTGKWSGSGRNPESNETSLMHFMEQALDGKGIDIQYGGHADALGISALTDIEAFMEAIEASKDLMKRKESGDRLTMDVSELIAPDALEKVRQLEPTGIGLSLPPVLFEGQEMNHNQLFKSGRKDWKTVRVKQEGVAYDVADWSYDERSYPAGGKKSNEIQLCADVSISQYKGEHIEFTAKFDRAVYLDRAKELGIEPVQPEQQLPISPQMPD